MNKKRSYNENFHNKNDVKMYFYDLFTKVGHFTNLIPPPINIRLDQP